MDDIIEKYKIKKRNKNIAIVLTSLMLAIWINFWVFSPWAGQMLKANVLWTQIDSKANLSIEKIDNDYKNILNIKANKNLNSLKSLSLSIVYNPEKVSIDNISTNYEGAKLVMMSDNKWFKSIIITFKNPENIKNWSELVQILWQKNQIEVIENINLINANFIDSTWETYTLSTSWTDF